MEGSIHGPANKVGALDVGVTGSLTSKWFSKSSIVSQKGTLDDLKGKEKF